MRCALHRGSPRESLARLDFLLAEINVMRDHYDCVVIGGGPAGCATATLVAEAGFYQCDGAAPIGAGTWSGARAARSAPAQGALSTIAPLAYTTQRGRRS